MSSTPQGLRDLGSSRRTCPLCSIKILEIRQKIRAQGKEVDKMGIGRPLPEDGFSFQNNKPNGLNLGCATIHQGGIVQAPDGK